MELESIRVSAQDVARAPSSRLDVRYYILAREVEAFFKSLVKPILLSKVVDRVKNGENLPASSYADDLSEAGSLYASVKSLSQFSLREASCIPLLADDGQIRGSRVRIEEVAVDSSDVLLTRSGTPGISWPGTLAPESLPVVPSGFLIRLSINLDHNPIYVACILNHPCWRLLTLALSAGKRQDNIGHQVLESIPLPRLDKSQEDEVAIWYRAALRNIERVLSDEPLTQVCDGILMKSLGLSAAPVEARNVSVTNVKLSDVASTPSLRADNRWHGSANRLIRSMLEESSVSMSYVVSGVPVKGNQPQFVDIEDEEGAFAIATSALQAGQIVMDYTKPVTTVSAQRFPVGEGELLVAMDGDGSIGKAGVVGASDAVLTVDSHVAVVPVIGDLDLKLALACWLNSTWGRTQTSGLMTGATGQTQLRPADFLSILVPRLLIERAHEVANEYKRTLATFEPPARRARQIICDVSASVTTFLSENGALQLDEEDSGKFGNAPSLRALLDIAYPSTAG